MMKYTQGPWAVFPRGGQVYIGVGKDTGDGILDAGFGVWGGGVERRDNAERIVACVNAMAGVDDPVGTMAEFHEMRGALKFIMAFYEPNQRHLDTEAWKHAEAGARRVLEKTRYLDALLSRMGGGE